MKNISEKDFYKFISDFYKKEGYKESNLRFGQAFIYHFKNKIKDSDPFVFYETDDSNAAILIREKYICDE